MARKKRPDIPNTKARRSKIGQLPESVREKLNRKIADGGKGDELLAWINALPEMRKLQDEKGVKKINAQNITDWRYSGYMDWVELRGKYPAHNQILDKLSIIERKIDTLMRRRGPII
jgi:hypothetical protein